MMQHLGDQGKMRMHMAWAAHYMDQGRIREAIKEQEIVYTLSAPNPPGDKALYMKGILWMHPDNEGQNYDQALDSFHNLISEFPNSRYRVPAQALIGVLDRISVLQQEAGDRRDAAQGLSSALYTLRAEYIRKMDACAQKLTACRQSIEQKELVVRNLQRQLQEIKQIDLDLNHK